MNFLKFPLRVCLMVFLNFQAVISIKTMYFAYGSNLLSERMHKSNPSAVRRGIAMLKDYSLDFGTYSTMWRGGGGNILENNNHNVWGVLWELDDEDFRNLDRQENVHINMYRRINLQVKTPEGKRVTCKSYKQTERLEEADVLNLPEKRRPSATYLSVIVAGAIESKLPQEYIDFLKNITTNGIFFVPNLELH